MFNLVNGVCLQKNINMKKTTTLLFILITFSMASFAQFSQITIDSARTDNANGVPVDSGLQVELTGTVYGPNSYPTANGDVFMLQGTTLGIKVYSKGTFSYAVNTGDIVTARGTLSTYHGQAELNLSYLTAGDTIFKVGTGTIDTPLVVSVVGETNESSLIQVNNVNMNTQTGWTVPHTKHSFNVHVGSLYLFIDSFMSPDLWNLSSAPAGTYNIVGFGSQYAVSYPYNSGYSLQPRSLADFHQINTGINTIVSDLTAAVFPNPASTKFTVTFSYDKEEPYTVKITDLTGRTVISENGTVVNGDNTLVFNTSGLSNGMYILELHTAEKSLVTKINISK